MACTLIQEAYKFFEPVWKDISEMIPVVAVGKFLYQLFIGHTLPHQCTAPHLCDLPLTKQHENVLHYCQNFSQIDLILTIFRIYNRGIPKSYQVFRCQSSSTEEEISQFMRRATKYPQGYLFLEVNCLPYEIQGVS